MLQKNAFAALDSAKTVKKASTKSKSSKEEREKKKSSEAKKAEKNAAELEAAIFANPGALGISSWADDDDEEDYAVPAASTNSGWSVVGENAKELHGGCQLAM
jgi:hypothetical protein